MMDLSTYQKYFYDRKLSGLGLFVKKGYNIDSTVENIRRNAGDMNLIVRSNRTLINSSIVIFDRTFLITNVLQLSSYCCIIHWDIIGINGSSTGKST